MLAQPNGQELGSRVSIPAVERAKDGASEILNVERRSRQRIGHPPDPPQNQDRTRGTLR